METGLQLLKTVGALALVLSMIFAIAYVLRRWGGLVRKPASQTMMEVLSKQSFGPRHHLFLVKVAGERKVLVGISPQNMSLLSVTTPTLSGKNAYDDVSENI
ncbi:MAG: flagellar biosynthetic protein FliO [Syntrophobacteraceae bacterium]|jgi:flagellar biosynthetic protein FliO